MSNIKPIKPIILYTSRTAPACRAVKMVATHLNISLEEVTMRCYIDTRTEHFRKINPCHTLPVINDNGFILWESRAIMQYLCNQYAPNSTLYPADPQKRAHVDRLLNFDLKTLNHSVMAVHYEFMFPCEYSNTRGEKFIAVNNALTLLEIFLINKNYVACEHLTIADISILASVTLLETAVEFDLSSFQNIWQWINRLRNELPYYDSLTKMVHDELRALIQSVRDAHDEWSSPLTKCAFTPKGDDQSHCIEEQRRQYQRLFSQGNTKNDVAKIMAAVIPVFRNNKQENNANLQISTSDNNNNDNNNDNDYLDDNKILSNGQCNKISNQKIQSIDNNDNLMKRNQQSTISLTINNGDDRPGPKCKKRVRLAIEPNANQSSNSIIDI